MSDWFVPPVVIPAAGVLIFLAYVLYHAYG
jgi:hypothetical protein